MKTRNAFLLSPEDFSFLSRYFSPVQHSARVFFSLSHTQMMMMNAARIHDKQKLKSYWEQRIFQHSEMVQEEENRMRSSSLARSGVIRLELMTDVTFP